MATFSTDNAVWRKATASSGTGGCVEVAVLDDGLVAVRDSKNPTRPAHIHSACAWREFTDLLAARGAVTLATDHLRAEVTAADVTLHTLTATEQPHTYTHHEWACFLDGVRHREPQLACA